MHPPLLIQAALRSGTTLDDLATEYGIKARRHGEIPNLVLLKYDQIASPMASPLVRECRGIILDEAENWRVVSRGFDKFFNANEGHAAPIDWATARVQEKLDGSLCVLYHHAGRWRVATSGSPDASGDVHGFGITFRELFWRTWNAQGGADPNGLLNPDTCYILELTSPQNRVVVTYPEPRLTTLAARDRISGAWIHERDVAPYIGIRAVQSFPLGSLAEIAATFESMSPLAQEGYVVVDAAGARIKVKHPGYVALHHMRDGMGPRAFLDIARQGETSEVEAAFPEYARYVNDARARVDALVAEVEADYARIRHHEVQKAFALEAVPTKLSGCLFALRAGKAESVRHYVRDMSIERLEQIVGRGPENIPGLQQWNAPDAG